MNHYIGRGDLLDYTSTKGAIVAFTRGLSNQQIHKGIRVNCVCPGPSMPLRYVAELCTNANAGICSMDSTYPIDNVDTGNGAIQRSTNGAARATKRSRHLFRISSKRRQQLYVRAMSASQRRSHSERISRKVVGRSRRQKACISILGTNKI